MSEEKNISDVLYRWLKKAYEMGVKRDRFSDQQSECDLPALDLSYVPKIMNEVIRPLLAERDALSLKVHQLENSLTNLRLKDAQDWYKLEQDNARLTAERDELKAKVARQKEAIEKLRDGNVKNAASFIEQIARLRGVLRSALSSITMGIIFGKGADPEMERDMLIAHIEQALKEQQ